MKPLLGTVGILVVAVAIGLGVRTAIEKPRPVATATTLPPSSAATTVPVDIVPAPGQTFVTGTVTSFSADNAIGPALKPPFTITIPSRGQGNADITGVAVAGQDVEIFWYGGQPLPVSGTGLLAIDGGAVTVDASGITWMLDGAPRTLTVGHFSLGAPVAVGSGGLATPHQNIAFDAGARSTLQTAGHAQVHLPPASLRLAGPGSLTLHGDFQVQSATATRHVQSVVFGPGSYDVELTPTASGDTIRATLQGAISFS